MDSKPIKSEEYFAKLLGVADAEVDYSDNPPTTAADWENAEYLLPVTVDEFRAIEQFIHDRRSHKTAENTHRSD